MDKLYKGIHKFRESYFRQERDFFSQLSRNQSPDVLFITCSDSRVDPNLITQSKPGNIFIVRNVGNIVPPYDSIKDKSSVGAALEFALLELKVADIIVCGHSNCGAMGALMREEGYFLNMPNLKDWLRLSSPAMDIVKDCHPACSGEDVQKIIEHENILIQLENIQTYPFIFDALKEGSVALHGWYYEIGTGEVWSYNTITEQFDIITRPEEKHG
ncbi:MAG: carbonic anhydrase [Thermodesulfovibrionales bacterium]|nr:carbonic anhydrase [Thermodesulfovibrionales bacterium]